jgi:indolepyruvate ferredoxin oxidoreductase, beta subunit
MTGEIARQNYDLAVEVARLRGLIKGYGDTHARGRQKYERLAALLPVLVQETDGAARLKELHKAALADETGEALDRAIGSPKQ